MVSSSARLAYPSGKMPADCANHRIQVLTTGGKFFSKFGEKGSEPGKFNNPCGIAMDSSSRVLVSDSSNNRIQVFGKDGGWLLTIDGKGSGRHGIVGPRSKALDAQGSIHVAAYGLNTVKVFTPEGAYIRRYGGGVREWQWMSWATVWCVIGEETALLCLIPRVT